MEPHRKKELIKIRKFFIKRYKLAKLFGDKYYTKYFARQIRDIDKELKMFIDNLGE
jgi:hypothetical protein